MSDLLKTYFLLIAVGLLFSSFAIGQSAVVNPTGTYKLVSKTTKKGEDIYGYSGEINIKVIAQEKILMSFFVTKGAPSYNLGSFVDTLDFKNNIVVYRDPEYDPTCKIIFKFSNKGIEVKQETETPTFACGFGQGVTAEGFYKKTSVKEPAAKVFEDI